MEHQARIGDYLTHRLYLKTKYLIHLSILDHFKLINILLVESFLTVNISKRMKCKKKTSKVRYEEILK